MTRPPSLSDLLWTFACTLLGLAIGVVAFVVWEAFR